MVSKQFFLSHLYSNLVLCIFSIFKIFFFRERNVGRTDNPNTEFFIFSDCFRYIDSFIFWLWDIENELQACTWLAQNGSYFAGHIC